MGNQFNETVESLLRGMDSFISAKAVVGDAVRVDDKTIILPLVDVSFGVGAGAFSDNEKKQNAGGGLGGKMSPSSILVLQDGKAKLVNIKNQDAVTKVMDLIPDLLDRIKKKDDGDIEDSPELSEAIQKASEE